MRIGWIKPTLVVPVIYADGYISHLAYSSKWLYNNRYNFVYSFVEFRGSVVLPYYLESMATDGVGYNCKLSCEGFQYEFDTDGKFTEDDSIIS